MGTRSHRLSAFALSSLAALLSSGASFADVASGGITLTYIPETQDIRIMVPDHITASSMQAVPNWVQDITESAHAQAPDTRTFLIDLPAPAFGSFAGGNAAGAYLMNALSWLPQSMGVEPPLVTLTMPASHRGVLTADLHKENVTEDTYTATFDGGAAWRTASAFFGPYEITEQRAVIGDAPLTLRTYFKPNETPLAATYLENSTAYLDRYITEIGPYPFEGFSIVSAPIPVGLAFDGVTYISEQILEHPYMQGRSLAHEILHNWWGSGVAVDYASGNWAEALTTFGADYALAEEEAPATARTMRQDWLIALSQLSDDVVIPLNAFQSPSQGQTIGYGKGAMVFHMLRAEIGQPAFDQAIRAFWAENAGRTAGWAEIEQAFEASAARDLSWFFDQWLTRAGEPIITLADADILPGTDADDPGHTARITLEQTAPAFELTVPVHIETEAGPFVTSVRLTDLATTADIAVPARPLSVVIDPDFEILRRLSAGERPATLQDLRRAPNAALLTPQTSAPFTPLITALLGDRAPDRAPDLAGADFSSYDAVIVAGQTASVLAKRAEYFGATPLPRAVEGEQSMAWVEKDDALRTWLFLAAEDPSTAVRDLRNLPFYGRQSYVAVPRTGRVSHGKLAPTSSPMQVVFAAQ